MTGNDTGLEILGGIHEIKDFKRGKGDLARCELSEPPDPRAGK